MSKTILALDPGKTTGYAFVDLNTMAFESGQTDFDETVRLLDGFGKNYGTNLYIVAESFIINVNTVKNTQAPWSLELIGVCRRASRLYTGRDLVLQAPASAKRFSSDEKLRRMGWYAKGMGHANDAARHLLLRAATTGELSQEKLSELITTT